MITQQSNASPGATLDVGAMSVDWEARIDFDRLRRDRLAKAQEALPKSEADVLFVFRTEHARYLTGYRHHLGPTALLGNAIVLLARSQPPARGSA